MEEECSLQRLALAWVHSFLGYWTCLSVVVAVVMVEAVDVVLVVAEPAASWFFRVPLQVIPTAVSSCN